MTLHLAAFSENNPCPRHATTSFLHYGVVLSDIVKVKWEINMVLLLESMFLNDQNGITLRITASECNTKMVSFLESLPLNVIPKWYVFYNQCF